jgi:hypothetical protein
VPRIGAALGAHRWFRSANVIDLWIHRSPDEKRRM